METLFAMLIIVLAVLMLAGSIVTAARINKSAKDLNVAFSVKNAEEVPGVQIKVTHQSGSPDAVSVKGYRTKDENKYCFYESP